MPRSSPRLVLLTLLLAGGCSAASPRKLLYEKKSAYNHITVTEDKEGRRYLQFEGGDGALQSQVRMGHPLDLELPYTRMAMVGLAFVPEPKRILIIGLGGGAMPMFLRTVLPKVHIDVVDIDPDVVDVARRYFGFREDAALRAHVGDGRRFIETAGPPYDLVFLDAYGSENIPEHLATREFLAATRARLSPGGAVVANVWETTYNPLYLSMVRTYQVSFSRLYSFAVTLSGNRILVGLASPEQHARETLEARAERLERAHRVPFDLSGMVAQGYSDVTEPTVAGRVLTDKPSAPPKARPDAGPTRAR
jgi:spermidine synthase